MTDNFSLKPSDKSIAKIVVCTPTVTKLLAPPPRKTKFIVQRVCGGIEIKSRTVIPNEVRELIPLYTRNDMTELLADISLQVTKYQIKNN